MLKEFIAFVNDQTEWSGLGKTELQAPEMIRYRSSRLYPKVFMRLSTAGEELLYINGIRCLGR
jgi:hypothetical protein